MIKVLKRHVCLCALTTSVFFFVPNIGTYAQNFKLSCDSLFKSYPCNFDGKHEGDGRFHTQAVDTGSVQVTDFQDSRETVLESGKIENSISNKTLKFRNSKMITVEVFNAHGTDDTVENFSFTGSGQKTQSGDLSRAVFGIHPGNHLFVINGKIDVTDIYGLIGESRRPIFFDNGFPANMSEFVVKNSNILIKGSEARGLYFWGSPLEGKYVEGELLVKLGELQFKNTVLKVPDGTAIYVDDARRYPYITVSDGSRIFANRLLEVKNNSYVAIDANASFLAGGARVDDNSYVELELSNNSKWTVKPGNNNRQDSKSTDSSVSFMRLIDSSIVFQKPKDAHYQTLHIGKLDDDAVNYHYIAEGNARLFVNASLATDGQNKGVKADKLLIYGNVYGKTKVHVVDISANSRKRKRHSRDAQRDTHSVSIIQVYGNAAEDSFKLAAHYVALRGAPYRYSLRAYGPSSSRGKAKDEKNLAQQKSGNSNGDFWDFRLEAAYVEKLSHQRRTQLTNDVSRRRTPRSVGSRVGHNHIVADSEASIFYPEMEIQAVVPQVPTYLLLPNALFHAGLMDISNQNKQLAILRASSEDLLDSGKKPAFFVRSYGGNHHYASDLSDLEYGYGGDLDYSAVEAGILLKAVESARHTLSFGVMGTYGKLSLQPQDVDQSQKSSFDKWIATAYGSMQHDAGFYIDGLFSYGLLKGDVLTLARGKTATLKSHPLSASLTVGKAFMTGHKGFVFDPQIQVIYQNLRFDKASDVDGFDIEMKKPDQWVIRVGGRLTKTLAASEEGRIVSFNGKLHLAHNLGEKQFVHFGDKFQLGAFGSSLEAGLGVNAQLSSKFALHGDVTYQHKLTKAGFSGVSFSGGLRYHF